jgi:hypothetical protein
MSDTVTVVLLGFGPRECQLLHAGLRDAALEAGQAVTFEPTNDAARFSSTDLVVVNSDDAESTDLVRRLGLLGRTVGVGNRPLPCVASQLARPLDVAAIADALTRLAPSSTTDAAESPGAQVARVLEQLAFFVDRAGRAGQPNSCSASGTAGAARQPS